MAADKYGVETKSIRNWKKQLPELLKMSDKSIKSTLHHGRKAETDEVENEIVDWILINRSLGISVSSWEVIITIVSWPRRCWTSSWMSSIFVANLSRQRLA